MPQIAQLAATYSSQIFWVLLTFGFVFFVIGLGMVPKIEATVDARDKRIADDIATAKAAFARADEIEEAYRTKVNESRSAAQKIAQSAKDAAARAAEVRVKDADGRIADQLASAEARIAGASASALAEIESVAAEAALDMVAKVSGASASPEAARNAVKAVLAHG